MKKNKYTAQAWISDIHDYMPVLVWLSKNMVLRNKIPEPILTFKNSYKCEDENYIYILFNYIDGQTIAIDYLTNSQQHELAEIISELHSYGQNIPVPTENIRESFNTSFCDELLLLLNNCNIPKDLSDSLEPYKKAIYSAIDEVKNLAQKLPLLGLDYVLCHTDVHGWNLMQAQDLMLIDWEGLKLAPAEADLFIFTDDFFFDYAGDTFFDIYRQKRSNYKINKESITFYRLSRRLVDINEFAKGIIHDNLTDEKRELSLNLLIKECNYLKNR